MDLVLGTPTVDDLAGVLQVLRTWQRVGAPIQLHPGDLGWAGQLGPERTAASLRTWHQGEALVALGFLDGPDVLRMTLAPEAWSDGALAEQLRADLVEPARGVLPEGSASVELPDGTALRALLDSSGWALGEPWQPLRRDLREPVEPVDLAVEVVGPEQVAEFTSVHRAAWSSPTFTDDRWQAMAAGPAYDGARSLLGRDADGTPVAGLTTWSAGEGRPGLVEPLGVHPDHRGRGYGTQLCVAAAAHLRELGASSIDVCTEASRVAAVATYEAAGFTRLAVRRDRDRPA